jgi:long-chain acyl-CoA synthetase
MRASGFTVYDVLLRNAFVHAERTALVYEGERLSYRGLLARVDALAAGLAGLGIGKGERICVLAQNHAAYLELYGACARQGLVAYPINWRLSPEEVGRVLERAKPALMVVDAFSLPQIGDWPATRRGIAHWYQFGSEAAPGLQPFESLYRPGATAAPAAQGEVADDDPFCVISTAAVDIVPRGAVLTHANVIASNVQTMALLGIDERDVNIVALPLFHIAALGVTLAVQHAGGCNVVMSRYDPAEAVRLIDAHGGTHISDFPPVLLNLLNAADEAGSRLASLHIVSGLESPDTIARLHQATGARFWTGFGQSETTGFVTLQPFQERPGAAGRVTPLARIRLVDDAEREVPVGTPGEICVRGPLVFAGYYDQPEVNAVTFRGGWHHTGDVGRFDADGYLHYVKRKPEKELIKPGGENVYPAEVETVILELAGVTGVSVIGVPDPQWGEAILAVVEAPAGHGLSAQDVIDHVGSRIARFKRPRTVHFSEALPRTDTGEVDREAVKELWGKAE